MLGVWVPHCPSKRQKVHGHVRPAREASKPAAVPVAKASSKAKALLRPSSRSRGRRAHLHHVPRPSCGFLLRYCMRCGSVRPSLRCCLRARVPPRVQGVRRPALGMHHSLELFGSQRLESLARHAPNRSRIKIHTHARTLNTHTSPHRQGGHTRPTCPSGSG